MERKRIGILVLVNSPQNSKNPSLPQVDLLRNPVFKTVVQRFDTALGVEPNQSLSEANQFASVVMSVASHSAFVHSLRERLQPGHIYPGDSQFKLRFIGHSVGEMASLIEAGFTDIDTMAWILNERQQITEQPFTTGVMRFMFAVVGVDMKKLEKNLKKPIKQEFGDTVQVELANKNTPSQGVVSVQASEGDPRSLAKKLTELFSELQHPDSERPLRFIHLANIRNAFHTLMLKPEEVILQKVITQRYSRNDFRVPEDRVVYSPMLGRWIRSDKDAWNVVNHQLTSGVGFSEGIQRMLQERDVAAFISADVRDEVTPQMLRDNIIGAKPILNVKDIDSLDETIEQTVKLLEKAA